MKTSADKLFSQISLHYRNIYNLLTAFNDASLTNQNDVTVKLELEDGTFETKTVNSFQKILNELTRIDNNFKSLINSDNISYIINGDGSLSSYQQVTQLNTQYFTDFKYGENLGSTPENAVCSIDNLSLLKQMIFPNVKLPIKVNKNIQSDIICSIYELTSGFDLLDEIPTILNINYLESKGDVSFTVTDTLLTPRREQVNFFGKFTVTSVSGEGNNFTVIVDKTKYGGIAVNGDNINLVVNDFLITEDGTTKFIVESINFPTKTIALTRVSGSGVPQTGIDKLFFNQLVETEDNVVFVPVEPNKKLVVFLKSATNTVVGYPNQGLKIDTDTFTVNHNGVTYSINEFFAEYVTNFGDYIMALIKETAIPVGLGVKPKTPTLLDANFKVIQINKHLTNQKSVNNIITLTEQKEKIKNDVSYRQTEIDLITNEIESMKYSSTDEKNYRISEISRLRSEINTLNLNLLNVSRDIDNNAITTGLKNAKPKYKLICYWDIQEPLFSPNTKPQNIVKYEVQYRYLSKNSDTVDSTGYKMISDGKEINVVVSSWNIADTTSLNKIINNDNSITWELQQPDNVDTQNINQALISIQSGESVEVRVRAISEAGFPIAPLKSNWSDILRKDFPSDLVENGLNSMVDKNNTDLLTAEFNGILSNSGLIKHIDNQILEGERLFKHKAEEIHSGFYTPEQKIIDLFNYLQTLRNDINILKNNDKLNNVRIELVDFNKETFIVKNNTTVELSGGNYSDNINLLDETKWGSIIRKQGFIKIRNTNTVAIELKTLVPGVVFDTTTAPTYYNVGVKTPVSLIQNSKQIIYFRNIDVTGQTEDTFKLIKPKYAETPTEPPTSYIDLSASEDLKNVVYLDSTDDVVKVCKLKPSAGTDFIAFTTEHPLYTPLSPDDCKDEFDRLNKYTAILKELQFQSEMLSTDVNGLGFVDNDFYNIGENSCGAYLYGTIPNPNLITVVGNTTISTLTIVEGGEILIPFFYEYRMMDRQGKVNGMNGTTISDDLTYSKKIGIDLIINNEPFKFDINISSKLKSIVTPLESLTLGSIIGSFTGDDEETTLT